MADEVQRNLTSSQILELIQFFHMQIERQGSVALMPLKVIFLSCKSREIIEHVEQYILESLGPYLAKQIRRKSRKINVTSERLFEIYFLMLELEDSLAVKLYHKKLVRRATKLCGESASLFPVRFRRGTG